MREDPGDRAELDFSDRWKNLFSKPNKSSVLRYFNDSTAPLLSTRNLSSLTVKCRSRVLVEPTTRNLLLSGVGGWFKPYSTSVNLRKVGDVQPTDPHRVGDFDAKEKQRNPRRENVVPFPPLAFPRGITSRPLVPRFRRHAVYYRKPNRRKTSDDVALELLWNCFLRVVHTFHSQMFNDIYVGKKDPSKVDP